MLLHDGGNILGGAAKAIGLRGKAKVGPALKESSIFTLKFFVEFSLSRPCNSSGKSNGVFSFFLKAPLAKKGEASS